MEKSPLRSADDKAALSAPNTPSLWEAKRAKGDRDTLTDFCCMSQLASGTKVGSEPLRAVSALWPSTCHV